MVFIVMVVPTDLIIVVVDNDRLVTTAVGALSAVVRVGNKQAKPAWDRAQSHARADTSALHDTTDHIDDLALELLPLYSTCTALSSVLSQLGLLITNSGSCRSERFCACDCNVKCWSRLSVDS